ncbi:class I SAM-dependent methyltransferase [Chloroflexota bacterium]
MDSNIEEPCYWQKGIAYITLALIGGGCAITALAIAFTVLSYSTWQLALCWFFGVILIIIGLFWDSMASAAYPANIRAQERNLISLLRTHWDGKGKVLDIGTGGGRLAVPIAREFPESNVIGVDIWMKSWDSFGLTKECAEKNALIDNVADRCTFQYGSALELPFEDGEFSLVVSAFTFHAISVPDRTVLFQDALRVLVPGGVLVICDLFPRGYGVKSVLDLLEKIKRLGVEDLRHQSLKDAGVNLGRLSFIWGMAYLSGKKRSS